MKVSNQFLTFSVLALAMTACGGGGTKGVPNTPDALKVPQRGNGEYSVTDAFGPLVVREGEFDATVDHMPWSGSWLPLKSPELFDTGDQDNLATLQKYDLYMKAAHDKTTHAADFEKASPELYDPNALGWEGRCDAWATASIFEREPIAPITVQGITFSVWDLKALLTKTYENTTSLKQYGRNFIPAPDADYNDIYPDQFQRAIQHELFENHRFLIFDNDPTEQVWNTPMYRAIFDLAADAQDAHVMHATAYIWGVSPLIPDPNYVGTITVKYIYTYDLYGTQQANGDFQVAFGEWTGDSKTDHPNFVSVITGDPSHSSSNSEITNEIVKEILASPR